MQSPGQFAAAHESLHGTDLPVVKSLASMPAIAGGADQDFDVPKGLPIDRP
jgi:hypothetical protein